MIQAPLQEVTEENRPRDTLGAIRLNINSPMPAMWVVVESDYDVKIYEKFFSENRLNVRSSLTEGEQSCNNVELIVKTVLEEGYERIVGIRDRDFIDFIESYHKPDHVYLTDQRDIEMQMLKSDRVVSSLKQKDSDIEQKIENVKPIAKAIGCYRIFNDIKEFGYSFNKKLKIGRFRDDKAHVLKQGALVELDSSFFEGRTEQDRNDFDNLKDVCDLKDFALVCNGHDFLTLLDCLATIPHLKEFLPQCYDIESFKQSALYSDLKDWADSNNVSLFEGT